jgi:hypothetical protein
MGAHLRVLPLVSGDPLVVASLAAITPNPHLWHTKQYITRDHIPQLFYDQVRAFYLKVYYQKVRHSHKTRHGVALF